MAVRRADPRMQGRSLGLLSFGAIAQAIAVRATAFGMRVMAHDPYMAPDDVAAHGASPVSFDDLISRADYLVIQAPLTKETRSGDWKPANPLFG
jgi:D-3-phosphoglycerate dehydrogenase / 2-oxoglutarate reductase